MRAVLDPNVLISAVLSRGGTPAALVRAWLAGAYELVVSPALLDELERVLGYPKIASRVPHAQARELVELLRNRADQVADPDTVPAIHSPDPDDDYLIALAADSRAVLVSGDTHLHGLTGQLPVYTPVAFSSLLAGD